MIVKMKFINISGPRDDIDRVMDLYLSRYEIQLESALTELKTVENLRPFVEINPYRDALLKAQQYVSYLNEPEKIAPDTSMGLDDIFELIRATNEEYLTFQARKDVLKRKQDELQAKQKVIEPFRPMDGDLGRILSFRYITCRFGKLPTEQYQKMEKYLMNDLGAIFVKGQQDATSVYGAYFVSPGEAQKVDAVFRSLHFERIDIPAEYRGTPEQASRELAAARYALEVAEGERRAAEDEVLRSQGEVSRCTALLENVERSLESLEGEEVEDWGFERAIVVSVEGAGKNARTFIWDNQVTVTLPDRLYDRIEVENENGSIQVGEIEAEQVSLEGDNGDITLTGTAGNEIAAHTQNGDVVLEEPDGMQYDCATKNGDIKATLTGTRADYQIATKGKMRLSGLWGDEKDAGAEKIPAKFETENGYIEVHFAG